VGGGGRQKRKAYWIEQFDMFSTGQKRQRKEQNKLKKEETGREIIAVAKELK
jgi:hypothetical protein